MARKRAGEFEEDGLQEYLQAAGKCPVLTREQEVALFQRLESGDETAREEIVTSNLRFVVKIALQFRQSGLPIADLIQEGNIGLLYVIDKFDWRKGFRFSTYAAYYIRQEIQSAVYRTVSMIRLPVRKARLLGKIQEVVGRYNELQGRDPSVEEVAADLGQPVERIEPLVGLRHSFASIDEEHHEEGGGTLAEMLASDIESPSAQVADAQVRTAVYNVLDFLTDRERKVIELRFGLEGAAVQSLRCASRTIGLSQEGVRRVEHRALAKLRRPAIRSRVEGLLTA